MKRNFLNGLLIIVLTSFLLPISVFAETNDISLISAEDKENNVSTTLEETKENDESTTPKETIENDVNIALEETIENDESTTPEDTIENDVNTTPEDTIKDANDVQDEVTENNTDTISDETTENEAITTLEETKENNIFIVSNEEEFRNAVAELNTSGGEKTIILNNNINPVLEIEVQVNNGTLTILGNGHTLSLWRLDIEGNATINLGKKDGSDKLILTSNNTVNSIIYLAHGATLNMYEGVTMKDSLSYGVPGAVYVANGSTFNMYGGLITNCSSNPCGGGVMISENSTFNMYGGTISNNTSDYAGGGVSIMDGTFNMTGGEIYGNTALIGGGVIVFYSTNSKFIMTNGAIHNNIAEIGGDDIVAENSDNLELNDVGSGLTLISDGKQITDWYYDGGRSTDEVNENGEIIYDETRWNASEIEDEQYLYKYTKPSHGVTAFLKAAHDINIQTDYTVVHEYYTNGVKDGEVKVTDGTGNVDSIIKADDINKLDSYNNNDYKYTSSNPNYIVLNKDGNNIIILRYDRTIQPDPVKPNDDSDDKSSNINPQTSDTTNITLWFILLFISLITGIITSTYNIKRCTK